MAQELYNYLKAHGALSESVSQDAFSVTMQDSNKRQELYQYMQSNGMLSMGTDFDAFNNKSFGASQGLTQQQPAQRDIPAQSATTKQPETAQRPAWQNALTRGITRVGVAAGDLLGTVYGEDFRKQQRIDKAEIERRQSQPVFSLRQVGQKWQTEGLPGAVKEIGGFVLESGLESAPLMGLAILNPPAFYAVLNEIYASDIAEKEGLTEQGWVERLKAVPITTIVGTLERLGIKNLQGSAGVGSVLKRTGAEMGLESVQGGVEEAGTSVMAGQPVSPQETLMSSLEEGVGATGPGLAFSAGSAVANRAARQQAPSMRDMLEVELNKKGYTIEQVRENLAGSMNVQPIQQEQTVTSTEPATTQQPLTADVVTPEQTIADTQAPIPQQQETVITPNEAIQEQAQEIQPPETVESGLQKNQEIEGQQETQVVTERPDIQEKQKSFLADVEKGKEYPFQYKAGDKVSVETGRGTENVIVLSSYIENGEPRYTVYPPGKKASVGAHFWASENDLKIRSGKKAVPKIQGMPDIESATMEENFDKELYHGSPRVFEKIEETYEPFGAIFAASDKQAAQTHGKNIHVVRLKNDDIATNHNLDNQDAVDFIDDYFSYTDATESEIDYLYDAIVYDEDLYRQDKHDLDRLKELFADNTMVDPDDMAIEWEKQRVRGLLAKKMGYKAVEMRDEYGTSYMILPGTKIEPPLDKKQAPKQPEEKQSQATTKKAASGDKGFPLSQQEKATSQYEKNYDAGAVLGKIKKINKTKLVNQPQVIESLKNVARAIGKDVPLRVGKSRTLRNYAGVYRVGPEVVRLRTANDISTATHEIGHALESYVFELQGITKNMDRELTKLGKDLYGATKPVGGYKNEGLAEYVRFYVTSPEFVQQKAPEFHKWFEQNVTGAMPEVKKQLMISRAMASEWQKQTSKEKAESFIIDKSSLQEKAKDLGQVLKKSVSKEKFIDMGAPLDRVAREAEKKTGKKLSISEDPFGIYTALRTTQSARIKAWLEKGVTDITGYNTVGGSLSEAVAPVKGQQKDFTLYLFARRAKAMLTDPKGARNPGISLSDANAIINELGSPEFEIAASKVYEWNDNVLDYFAQSSDNAKEIVENIRERDPGDYVPLSREFEEIRSIWDSAIRQGGNPMKRLKGSGRRIKDPISTMVSNAERMIGLAHKEMVMDAVLKLSEIDGMGHIIERVPVDQVPAAQRSVSEMLKTITGKVSPEASAELMGIVDQGMYEELITMFQPAYNPKAKPDEAILPVRRNGKTEWYQVDPELLHALSGMDVYRLGPIAEMVFGLPASLFRAGTTGVRASFGLVTNPIRDLPTMYANSRANGAGFKLLGNYFREFISAVGSRVPVKGEQLQGPWMDAFLRLGGEMAQPMGQDFIQTKRATRRMFENTWLRTIDVRNWYDFYRDLVQTPESVPRIAEMKTVAGQIGWKPGQPMTLDQSLEMLRAAKQVTVDFTAAGEVARAFNRAIPFFNAAIQGPRASLRAGKRNPALFALKGFAAITLPTLLNWLLIRDEDWYTMLPDKERFLYWHIPFEFNGRKEVLRIPRPFEIGAFFAALPEMLVDAAYRDDPKKVLSWLKNTWDVMSPDLEPVLPRVVAEQLANKKFFFDSPIVPRGEQDKPAEEQYNEYTTRLAVFLGDKLKWSPRRIDHAIEGIFGPVSRDIVTALRLGPEYKDREKELTDTALIGRLFLRGGDQPYGTKTVDDFYNMYGERLRIQRSDRIEETEDQRQARLLLKDASQAISALSYLRRQAYSVDDRREMAKEINRIAFDAMKEAKSGKVSDSARRKFKLLRKSLKKQKEKMQKE